MALMTLKSASDYDSVPTGAYNCTFRSLEETENDYGKAYRWTFTSDNGQLITGISGRDSAPSPKNKTGRWLAALVGKAPSDGLAVDPDACIGRRYLCMVTPNALVATPLAATRVNTLLQNTERMTQPKTRRRLLNTSLAITKRLTLPWRLAKRQA